MARDFQADTGADAVLKLVLGGVLEGLVDILGRDSRIGARQGLAARHAVADVRLHEEVRTESQQVRTPLDAQGNLDIARLQLVTGRLADTGQFRTFHLIDGGRLDGETGAQVELIGKAGMV